MVSCRGRNWDAFTSVSGCQDGRLRKRFLTDSVVSRAAASGACAVMTVAVFSGMDVTDCARLFRHDFVANVIPFTPARKVRPSQRRSPRRHECLTALRAAFVRRISPTPGSQFEKHYIEVHWRLYVKYAFQFADFYETRSCWPIFCVGCMY